MKTLEKTVRPDLIGLRIAVDEIAGKTCFEDLDFSVACALSPLESFVDTMIENNGSHRDAEVFDALLAYAKLRYFYVRGMALLSLGAGRVGGLVPAGSLGPVCQPARFRPFCV